MRGSCALDQPAPGRPDRGWLLSSWGRVQALFSPSAAMRQGNALTAAGKLGAAFEYYSRAARAGLAIAEYRVGRCYLEATGVPRSRIEALRWLVRAANHGHIEASSLLAILYLNGLGTEQELPLPAAANLFASEEIAEPDYVRALPCARRAAEAGSADGQAVLAYILSTGPQELRDLREADFWYERAAGGGSPHGMLGHAQSLARNSAQPDHAQLAALLSRAADAGLPTALHLLGVVTEHGIGVARDPTAASELFRRAAEKGHRDSQLRWGLALLHGEGVPADPSEAECWLRRAALAGDRQAGFLVGRLYATGSTLPPNFAEAAIWFRRAAEAGHADAARALGQLYLTGAGVPSDAEEAAKWFRVAAHCGNSAAQAELANLLLQGIGEQDERSRSCQASAQAVASGDLMAAFNDGVGLCQGMGVPGDEQQAALWSCRAAPAVTNAQNSDGRLLVEGRGVQLDLAQGGAWFARAVEAGMAQSQLAAGEICAAVASAGGADGPADQVTAQQGLAAAAAAGHPEAELMLGRKLAREHDQQRAPYWLSTALALEQTEAGKELNMPSLAHSPLPPPDEARCVCGSGLRSRRCCDLDPGYFAAPETRLRLEWLLERAAAEFSSGNSGAAETLCLNLLDMVPRLPRALWILAQIRQRGGQLRAVQALLERLITVDPNNVDAVQELALVLFQAGDLGAAEQHARNAVRLAPAHPRSHNLMGMIMTEAHRPAVGEYHCRRVLELTGARDPILLANLAWNLKGQGKLAEARQLYEESTQAAPEVFQTWFGWAQLEEADRDFSAAETKLDKAVCLRPHDPGLQVVRAVLLQRKGQYAEALASLAPLTDICETRLGPAVAPDPNALLETGRILDCLERYDEAFTCFDEAKRRARATTGKSYLEAEAQGMADRLGEFFVSGRVRLLPRARTREDSAQPIFILGFPRSGTTLAEQVLSGHSKIVAGDELPFINHLTDAVPRLLGSPLPYPEALSELWMGDNQRGLETLRDEYLRQAELRDLTNLEAPWFTDKMPLNEMHLGFISLLFPRSPLIHILRHPLDVVLSAFSHHLTHGYFCAYALKSIAQHYVLVINLVQHYRTQLALRYLPVRYEDMVEDLPGTLGRMLDFIGEPFEERCIRFEDNRRLPQTPSYAQVTKGLHACSRFRYRHYLRNLEPVIPILQPVIERLGYTAE